MAWGAAGKGEEEEGRIGRGPGGAIEKLSEHWWTLPVETKAKGRGGVLAG